MTTKNSNHEGGAVNVGSAPLIHHLPMTGALFVLLGTFVGHHEKHEAGNHEVVNREGASRNTKITKALEPRRLARHQGRYRAAQFSEGV